METVTGPQQIIIKPTVGRIVHYKCILSNKDKTINQDPTISPAIVTHINSEDDNEVSLAVFYPNAIIFIFNVTKGQNLGQWDWMPFQKDQQVRLNQGTNGDFNASVSNGAGIKSRIK